MIEIRLGEDSFEQDIRPLVRAFFPREEIKVEIGGAWIEPKSLSLQGSAPRYQIGILHDERQIRIWFLADTDEETLLQREYHLEAPEPDR